MTEDTKKKDIKHTCPYCEGETGGKPKLPVCSPCEVTLLYCTTCNTAVERDAKVCPKCGGQLEWK